MSAPTQRNWQSSQNTLELLRTRIAKIESRSPDLNLAVQAEAWRSGHAAMDAALGAIGFGALHEIMPDRPAHLPSASVFALGLIARLPRRGPLLWCVSSLTQNEHGALYAPGVAAFGIDPSRIVCVTVRHPKDLNFVLEEAARLSSLAAIIAEGPLPSFTASRRLALLLAVSQVPMLFLPDGKAAQGSAAATRLVVGPLAAAESVIVDPVSFEPRSVDPRAPGPPAFQVSLARNRGGRPGLTFEMVFDHANSSFAPYSRASSDSVPDREFSANHAPKWQRRA